MLEATEIFFIPNFAINPNNSIQKYDRIKVINRFYMNKYKQSDGRTHDIAFLQL